MKRSFLLLLLCAVISVAGCSDWEYDYVYEFYADNLTGRAIEIISDDGELLAKVNPGEKTKIFAKKFRCARNAKSIDYFPDGTKPITWLNTNKVMDNGVFLSQDFWLRGNWTFEGGRYYSRYTLTADEEFISGLTPPEEEPQE